VPADEFSEGTLGLLPSVALQQLQIRVAHLQEYIATVGKTGPKKLRLCAQTHSFRAPGSTAGCGKSQ
jgi:hypothetical protein